MIRVGVQLIIRDREGNTRCIYGSLTVAYQCFIELRMKKQILPSGKNAWPFHSIINLFTVDVASKEIDNW